MKKIDLLNLKGEKVNELKLNEEIFSITPNDKVLYDAIILTRASLRQGTHSTKNRSEVSGGGRKPWRQKGTGHARQGSIRAVQWVGGGRFGTPVPRDYSKKMNRKERRLALKSAVASKIKDFVVVDELSVNPKTKEMAAVLNNLNAVKSLVVVEDNNNNAVIAARNIPTVKTASVNTINVYDILKYDSLVLTKAVVEKIEEVYA